MPPPRVAQAARAPQGFPAVEVGLGLSAYAYSGELSAGRFAQTPGPGFAAQALLDNRSLLTPVLTIAVGSFSAQRPDFPARIGGGQPNSFVQTRFTTGTLAVRARFLRAQRLRPYAGLGIGLILFFPHDAEGRALTGQASTRAPGEAYGNTALAFQLQAGGSYAISPLLSAYIHYTWLQTGTQYLDNIGQLGQAQNDALHSLTLGLGLRLGGRAELAGS
jgi:opacity protein-like surface antigen